MSLINWAFFEGEADRSSDAFLASELAERRRAALTARHAGDPHPDDHANDNVSRADDPSGPDGAMSYVERVKSHAADLYQSPGAKAWWTP